MEELYIDRINILRTYIIENYDKKYNEYIDHINTDRKNFIDLYPLETLEQMKLEEYDKLKSKNSFMNLIERNTKTFGSGHLSFNANKLFYQASIDGVYHANKFIDEKYNAYNSLEEKFEHFICDVKNFVSNFIPEKYKHTDFLSGCNIIKIKLILLYREDVRLSCITSINPCIEIVKHFNIKCKDTTGDSISYNFEITEFLDSLDESFKKKNILVLSFLLWDYYKNYIQVKKEKNDQGEEQEIDETGYSEEDSNSYELKNFIDEVYIDYKESNYLIELLKYKKNIILQGPPGTGKTYMAKRLAKVLVGNDSDKYIKFIQFHQSYSYEDFILGYKPDGQGFKLVDGVFYNFCLNACSEEDNDKINYVFIIDEINRGNISKIFGELLMLIEKEYRGSAHQLELAYDNRKFYLPKNLYIIGMMNTADRSLAVLDYALKRRFGFYTVKPAFDNEKFKEYLESFKNSKLKDIIKVIKEINQDISNDPSLGDEFEIGHSYFCNLNDVTDDLLYRIVSFEILPLLKEYWYDEKTKYILYKNRLLGIINEQ